MAASAATPSTPAAARPLDRLGVALWETVGGLVILLVGSFLHFAFELSDFSLLVAPFGAVNESTWEHLKLFYWPGVAMAVIQHAYLRHRVPNFWLAKGAAVAVTPIGVALAFYCYLGIVLPIDGTGTLSGTIVTAIIGIALGQYASYRLLTSPPRPAWTRHLGIALILSLGVAMVAFTFAPPHMFLFENFYGYQYSGDFGILEDYTPYLIFR